MSTLESLVTTGRIVDLMLLFVVVEVALIGIYRRRRGGGIAMVPLLVNVGAGGALMIALRMCATQAGWRWVAVFLVTALLFHVADLAMRWSTRADGRP